MSTIKSLNNQGSLLKSIRNKYQDQTVIILGCSPFLTDYKKEDMEKLLRANKVIAIKQSYNLFKNFIDIHAYNCCNIQNYNYGNQKPMVIEASSVPPSSNPFDLYFHIKDRAESMSLSSLCLTNDTSKPIDKWTLSQESNILRSAWNGCDIHLRPYGPGIMSELIFYVCEHLGFSRIILIGCDNESNGGKTHFYRDDNNQCGKISNDPHHNSPWISFNKEKEMYLKLMGIWNDWFSKKNISLEVVSKFNNYPKSIKKTKINEII